MFKKNLSIILCAAAFGALFFGCSHEETSSGYIPFVYFTPSKPQVSIAASEYKNGVKVTWSGENWDNSNCKISRFTVTDKNGTTLHNNREVDCDSTHREAVFFPEKTRAVDVSVVMKYLTGTGYATTSGSASYDFTYAQLSTPTNVNVTKVSDTKVQVSWTSTKAMGYKIWYYTSNDPSLSAHQEYKVGKDKNTFDIDLSEYKYHYFSVAAYDNGGTSAFSEKVQYFK